MELLRNLPGISVRKREVQPSPTGKYNNVTELNILYPYSRQASSNGHQQISASRFGHRVNSTSLHLRPESMVHGTSVTMPSPDPRSILKRPKNQASHENAGNRIFLRYNAAQSRPKSLQFDPNEKRMSRKLESSQSLQGPRPKGPSKNVTFNLDGADGLELHAANQWSVGISKISRPITMKRRVTFKDQKTRNSKRDSVSQRERRIYYLPLLLKGRANGRKAMMPSTAEPSQRFQQKQSSPLQPDENGKARLRTMADEYRRGLHLGSLTKTEVRH